MKLQHGSDELLMDATIVYTLCKSHRQAEAARTWERLLSDVKTVKDKPAGFRMPKPSFVCLFFGWFQRGC